MKATLVLCLALAVSCAFAKQVEGDLVILSTTSHLPFKTTSDASVSLTDVAGVIGHVSGVGSSFRFPSSASHGAIPVGHPARKPSGTILFLVNGVVGADEGVLEAGKVASFQITAEQSESEVARLARLMTGRGHAGDRLFEGRPILNSEPASLVDVLSAHFSHSVIVSLASNQASLAAISRHPEAVTGDKIYSLLLESSTVSLQGSESDELIAALLSTLNDEVAGSEDQSLLGRELAAARALVAKIDTLKSKNSPDFYVIAFEGLEELRAAKGANSAEYKAALQRLKSVLYSLSKQFAAAYDNEAVAAAALLTPAPLVPVAQPVLARKKRAAEADTSKYVSTYTCYDNFDACMAGTGNCTARASCSLKKQTTRDDVTKECWTCNCGADYQGEVCEYIDMSIPFTLTVMTTLILISVIAYAALALGYMDPDTDSLIYRTSIRPKTN